MSKNNPSRAAFSVMSLIILVMFGILLALWTLPLPVEMRKAAEPDLDDKKVIHPSPPSCHKATVLGAALMACKGNVFLACCSTEDTVNRSIFYRWSTRQAQELQR